MIRRYLVDMAKADALEEMGDREASMELAGQYLITALIVTKENWRAGTNACPFAATTSALTKPVG